MVSRVPTKKWKLSGLYIATLVFLICTGLMTHFHHANSTPPVSTPAHGNGIAEKQAAPSSSARHDDDAKLKVDETGEDAGRGEDDAKEGGHDPVSNQAGDSPRDTSDHVPSILAAGRAPLNDWSTIEAEYRRRAADESLPKEVRSDAASKANFRFAEWRGRGNYRIGGFEFMPGQITLLEGWEVVVSSDSILASDLPPMHVERILNFQNDSASLFIRIRVAMSTEWAQQLLLQQKRSATSGLAHTNWGDLHGIEVGDVWFSDPRLAQRGAVREGSFDFTRRNVWVHVEFDNGSQHGEPPLPYALDLMSLGRQIDEQIKEQGVPGGEWSDIAQHCPKITQFESAAYHLPAKRGTRTALRHNVAADANGDAIELFTASEGAVKLDITWREPFAEVAHFDPDSLPEEPFNTRCWLIAVNTRNLLFTVAEITFTLDKR